MSWGWEEILLSRSGSDDASCCSPHCHWGVAKDSCRKWKLWGSPISYMVNHFFLDCEWRQQFRINLCCKMRVDLIQLRWGIPEPFHTNALDHVHLKFVLPQHLLASTAGKWITLQKRRRAHILNTGSQSFFPQKSYLANMLPPLCGCLCSFC